MKYKNITKYIYLISILFLYACQRNNDTSTSSYISPQSGDLIKSGTPISIRLNYATESVDSIQYFVDTTKIKTAKDTSSINIESNNFPLGSRLLTAKIYKDGKIEEVTTNIVLVSSITPQQFGYKVVNTYPHSTEVYTEGLEYVDGVIYESAGDYGHSYLIKQTLEGKVLQKQKVEDQYFAEGITVLEDKIIQLTYKEKVGFEYDKNTFKLLKTFPYNHANEGWGLCYDGQRIYNSDGSNRIFFLDKNSYLPTGNIEVYDDKGPVTQLNELEYIDGKIYANIYTSELIAVINPKSGAVEAYINMIGLPHAPVTDPDQDVLNGIAYDKKGKRLFVTGKKWDKLFQIDLIKQ